MKIKTINTLLLVGLLSSLMTLSAKSTGQEATQEIAKETAKETVKEATQEMAKETAKEAEQSDTAQSVTTQAATTQAATTQATTTQAEADKKAGLPNDNPNTKGNDTFIPSEAISEDLAVSFPIDI